MEQAEDQEASTSTTIDDLPSEVLCPIISSLPYKEQLKVAGVSSRWHSTIDSMLGRKLFLGKFCQFTPEDEERYRHHYVPIQTISKVGVNTCYVGEIVEPIYTSNLAYYLAKLRETVFGKNIPTFKNPYLVHTIFFDGPLPPAYFDALIRQTKNLQRLDIHLSSLCNLNPANMELPTKNKLETLNIWGHRLTQGLFTSFYSPKQIVGNLLTLLEQNNFISLNNFGIEYPFDLRDETTVTEKVFDFLKRHGEIIQKFKISINLFVTEEPTNMETVQDRMWVQKAKSVSKVMKLKNIEVVITSIYRVRLTKIWMGFIESQHALESVTIMTFRLLPDILYRVCEQNYKTLNRIGLTRLVLNENGRFTSINCSIFQNCIHLKALFLEAMQTGLLTPGLVDTRNLPQSLERIEIGNIMILSQDCHDLLCGLPALKDVFLRDTGHVEELGVSFDTVKEVIQSHRITNVTLYASLNGPFPQEGISNGHPFLPSLITARPFGMIEMTIGEDGFYKNVPRENVSFQTLLEELEE